MAKAWIRELGEGGADGCEITIEFMSGKQIKGYTCDRSVSHWGYNLWGLVQCLSDPHCKTEAVACYNKNQAAEDKHYFEWLIEQNDLLIENKKAQIAALHRENISYEEILAGMGVLS